MTKDSEALRDALDVHFPTGIWRQPCGNHVLCCGCDESLWGVDRDACRAAWRLHVIEALATPASDVAPVGVALWNSLEPYVMDYLKEVRRSAGGKLSCGYYGDWEYDEDNPERASPKASWQIAESLGLVQCLGSHRWSLTALGLGVVGYDDAVASGIIVRLAQSVDPVAGHISTERDAIELAAHLNCPACGGSGHVDDVTVDPVAGEALREALNLWLHYDAGDWQDNTTAMIAAYNEALAATRAALQGPAA